MKTKKKKIKENKRYNKNWRIKKDKNLRNKRKKQNEDDINKKSNNINKWKTR